MILKLAAVQLDVPPHLLGCAKEVVQVLLDIGSPVASSVQEGQERCWGGRAVILPIHQVQLLQNVPADLQLLQHHLCGAVSVPFLHVRHDALLHDRELLRELGDSTAAGHRVLHLPVDRDVAGQGLQHFLQLVEGLHPAQIRQVDDWPTHVLLGLRQVHQASLRVVPGDQGPRHGHAGRHADGDLVLAWLRELQEAGVDPQVVPLSMLLCQEDLAFAAPKNDLLWGAWRRLLLLFPWKNRLDQLVNSVLVWRFDPYPRFSFFLSWLHVGPDHVCELQDVHRGKPDDALS
mmetsp:Transcript_41553/g.117548  ORF Transcript_41553/g.117548 Transcript_41553/m.117548 type:complete len:289 (+) Transcript_41553:585-1451(+)